MPHSLKVFFNIEQDEEGYPGIAVESVWAMQTEHAGVVEISNVPFFAVAATLGDIVAVREVDGRWWFERLVKASSNSLARVVFFDLSARERVSEDLAAYGCSVEYLAQKKMLAVSIPEATDLASVRDYLDVQAGAGLMDYEEPILRHAVGSAHRRFALPSPIPGTERARAYPWRLSLRQYRFRSRLAGGSSHPGAGLHLRVLPQACGGVDGESGCVS